MKRFGINTFYVILVAGLLGILFNSAKAIIDLPESTDKSTLIVVLLPIVGAICVGIGIELFKFYLQKQIDDKKYNSSIIADVTKRAFSISQSLIMKGDVVRVKNGDQYRNDFKELIYLVSSNGSAECIGCIEPFIESLKIEENLELSIDNINNSLVNVIVSLRESLGYKNTKKSTSVLLKMFNCYKEK